MKKLDVGQVISILANIGVIAGIVFLAIELQQNNAVLEAQSRASWVDRQASLLETMAVNPELYEIMLRGASDPTSLSPLDRARFLAIGHRTLAIFEHQFNEMERGRLDVADVIKLQQAVYHATTTDFGTRLAWTNYRSVRASAMFADWFQANVIENPL